MLEAKVVEKIKTCILCSITYFFPENRAVYKIMWKNIVEPDRQRMKIRLMRLACSIPKAINMNSEYYTQFSLQNWLPERASLLGYTYIVCLGAIETVHRAVRTRHLSIIQ